MVNIRTVSISMTIVNNDSLAVTMLLVSVLFVLFQVALSLFFHQVYYIHSWRPEMNLNSKAGCGTES